LPLGVDAISASVQDRDGAAKLIKKTRRLFPFVRHVFADGGYSETASPEDLAAQRVTLVSTERGNGKWMNIGKWKHFGGGSVLAQKIEIIPAIRENGSHYGHADWRTCHSIGRMRAICAGMAMTRRGERSTRPKLALGLKTRLLQRAVNPDIFGAAIKEC
jgi:hypothetical protein